MDKKELYEKAYAKQMKYVKQMLCAVFIVIGLIFSVIGIILLVEKVVDEEGFMLGKVFLPMGIIFILLALSFLFIPVKGNYEKYKKRTEKYGFIEFYDVSIKLTMLDENCKTLEKRIEELEK